MLKIIILAEEVLSRSIIPHLTANIYPHSSASSTISSKGIFTDTPLYSFRVTAQLNITLNPNDLNNSAAKFQNHKGGDCIAFDSGIKSIVLFFFDYITILFTIKFSELWR